MLRGRIASSPHHGLVIQDLTADLWENLSVEIFVSQTYSRLGVLGSVLALVYIRHLIYFPTVTYVIYAFIYVGT